MAANQRMALEVQTTKGRRGDPTGANTSQYEDDTEICKFTFAHTHTHGVRGKHWPSEDQEDV